MRCTTGRDATSPNRGTAGQGSCGLLYLPAALQGHVVQADIFRRPAVVSINGLNVHGIERAQIEPGAGDDTILIPIDHWIGFGDHVPPIGIPDLEPDLSA